MIPSIDCTMSHDCDVVGACVVTTTASATACPLCGSEPSPFVVVWRDISCVILDELKPLITGDSWRKIERARESARIASRLEPLPMRSRPSVRRVRRMRLMTCAAERRNRIRRRWLQMIRRKIAAQA